MIHGVFVTSGGLSVVRMAENGLIQRVGKQLAKIFGYKNRQLTDSRLLTLDKEEFHLLKLIRAGADDEDLIEILKCTKKELKEKKEKLDKKITRWT